MAALFAAVQRYHAGHRHETHAAALSRFRDAGGLDWLRSDFNELALWQPTRRALLARELGHTTILPRAAIR
jgi:hypothetical protein